ncbi:amidohydrolase [Flavobacteriaceae bacterium]|uniref:amidohydrolase n=1 Tax=Candidatus Arcticimaribacter forsetii TaxID=2820661 RepID=UPI002076ED82|nr:amidohydrolase [Candidatus Arcticimaribacter forsetii]MDA8699026.1 amidohydrolase [Flavobacteriaceae bacterium]MDB2345774.1 amidohydrolase [Flavobacteriaceae bacterium]MDB4620786.1 amidohydrolase [Flavobacteriaceae bacterium]MDB4674557.1 amidohydrolase [Flavobacteriaceae bacterium]MDB4751672.1 amidohydrolase [Flavobacteriaceae bacterium]
MKKATLLSFCFLFLIGCTSNDADLIIHNADIYTVNKEFDKATALVVKNGKFIAVGGEDLLEMYDAKSVVDLNGFPVYPGFIDAHCHFYNFGLLQEQLDLSGTKSFDEVVEKISEYIATHPGVPVLGQGWDQNTWEVKEYPTKEILDQKFPTELIAIKRVDGHALLVNQKVLDLAGIDDKTEIEGGVVVRVKGALTGVLIDNAMDPVYAALPKPTVKQQEQALLAAQEICFQNGLTTVDDAGLDKEQLELIERLHEEDILNIRVYGMISNTPQNLEYYLKKGKVQTERLNIRSVKVYADGALGSRGAALKEDYSDDHGNRGSYVTPVDEIISLADVLAKNGFQMNTHAIGDAANYEVLKAYKKALTTNEDPRWRIEHAQVVTKEDRQFFGSKIIPSIQPTHATSDMFWADERLGKERIQGAYAYKSLLDWSGKVALGTDFPVEHVSPLKTFFAAVARTTENQLPEGGFQMEDALTRPEALKGMTIWAAHANFEEEIKGSIEIGKVADLVILKKDIMKIDVNEIPDVEVLATILNGDMVYRAPK